jgi:hypothetical protein
LFQRACHVRAVERSWRMTTMELGNNVPNKLLNYFLNGTEDKMLKRVNFFLSQIWSNNVGGLNYVLFYG